MYFIYQECLKCSGTRLNKRALSVRIKDVSFGELCKMELEDLLSFLEDIDDTISRPILSKVRFLLQQLVEIGVGYLSLERPVSTLSGGESQRIKMA